jgi:hypothetical protein
MRTSSDIGSSLSNIKWRTHCHIFLHHSRRRRIGHTALSQHDRPRRRGRLRAPSSSFSFDRSSEQHVRDTWPPLRLYSHYTRVLPTFDNRLTRVRLIVIILPCLVYYIHFVFIHKTWYFYYYYLIYILTPFLLICAVRRLYSASLIYIHPCHCQNNIDISEFNNLSNI